MAKKISKTDLFLKLAQPDEKGVSRWVEVSEFTGDYERLQIRNGGHCCRKGSLLAKTYNIEIDKSRTQGDNIDAIRLNGYRKASVDCDEALITQRKDNHQCTILDKTYYNPVCEATKKYEPKICKICRETYINSILTEAYSKRKNLCLGKFTVEVVKKVIDRIYGKDILYDYEIEETIRRCLSERDIPYGMYR